VQAESEESKKLEELGMFEETSFFDQLAESSMPDTPAAEEEAKDEEEALPEIITADMLRARQEQRKSVDIADADFEIPAELLVGLNEEDLPRWARTGEN